MFGTGSVQVQLACARKTAALCPFFVASRACQSQLDRSSDYVSVNENENAHVTLKARMEHEFSI